MFDVTADGLPTDMEEKEEEEEEEEEVTPMHKIIQEGFLQTPRHQTNVACPSALVRRIKNHQEFWVLKPFSCKAAVQPVGRKTFLDILGVKLLCFLSSLYQIRLVSLYMHLSTFIRTGVGSY